MATRREVELEAEVAMLRAESVRLAAVAASVRARVLAESEPEIVRLAVAVAERVVGRELATDRSIVIGWIREALGALSDSDGVVVAVAPDLTPIVTADDALRAAVHVDASLRAGSCEVRAAQGTVIVVDAADRLASVTDALGLDIADGAPR